MEIEAKLLRISKVAGICLAVAILAIVLDSTFAPTFTSAWATPLRIIACLLIAATVLPLALLHAALAGWAEETLERLDRIVDSPAKSKPHIGVDNTTT